MQSFDLGIIKGNRILLIPTSQLDFCDNPIQQDWRHLAKNPHGYSYAQLREGTATLKKQVLPSLIKGTAITALPSHCADGTFNWVNPTAIADSYLGSDAITITGFHNGKPDLQNGRHRLQCARDAGLAYLPVRWASSNALPSHVAPWQLQNAATRARVLNAVQQTTHDEPLYNLTQSQPKGNPAMSTSAEEQIGLLEELKNYLNTFQERLQSVSDSYQNKVEALDGSLLTNIHSKFLEEELEPARELISKLCDLINDSSLPAVQKRIEQLENILNDQ